MASKTKYGFGIFRFFKNSAGCIKLKTFLGQNLYEWEKIVE